MLDEVGKSRSTIQNDEITDGKSCKRQLVYWSLNPSASWVRLISLRMEVFNLILWNVSLVLRNGFCVNWQCIAPVSFCAIQILNFSSH